MIVNHKLRFLSLFLLILVVCSGSVVAQNRAGTASNQSKLQKVIDSYIAKAATKDGASEYEEARKIVSGDIDGDGDNDAIVQYTLEGAGGGNSWGQLVAVFINNKGVYKAVSEYVVGGKLSRSFTLKSVSKGKIIGATETCADTPQGLCENPKKGRATLVFRRNKLKEI